MRLNALKGSKAFEQARMYV